MARRVLISLMGAALLLIPLAGCHREGKMIPRSDMARIYADMLVADQWLNDNRKIRKQADTTLFYEPIFERYGYTTADYTYSVRRYMKDPERFARILKKSSSLLGARVRKIKLYQDAMKRIAENAPEFVWEPVEVFRYYDTLFFDGADTARIQIMMDSLGRYLPVFPQEDSCTCDSLAVADSLQIPGQARPDQAMATSGSDSSSDDWAESALSSPANNLETDRKLRLE